MVVGGFNSQRYLMLSNWQALTRSHSFASHWTNHNCDSGWRFLSSQSVQQSWQDWQAQGLYIFFLPPYSPQMNRIEDKWLHLKRHELTSQLFEHEYDLAVALIAAILDRGERRGYPVERFIFNSG